MPKKQCDAEETIHKLRAGKDMWARRSLQPQPEGILQDHRIWCIARSQRASPAAGEVAIKDREQFKLMNDAFG